MSFYFLVTHNLCVHSLNSISRDVNRHQTYKTNVSIYWLITILAHECSSMCVHSLQLASLFLSLARHTNRIGSDTLSFSASQVAH